MCVCVYSAPLIQLKVDYVRVINSFIIIMIWVNRSATGKTDTSSANIKLTASTCRHAAASYNIVLLSAA